MLLEVASVVGSGGGAGGVAGEMGNKKGGGAGETMVEKEYGNGNGNGKEEINKVRRERGAKILGDLHISNVRLCSNKNFHFV